LAHFTTDANGSDGGMSDQPEEPGMSELFRKYSGVHFVLNYWLAVLDDTSVQNHTATEYDTGSRVSKPAGMMAFLCRPSKASSDNP
jgi:hypothetical protein